MQPREKLIQKGINSLSDLELLAVLVGTGYKGKSYRDVAKGLLREIRRLLVDDSLEVGALRKVDGVGESKACKILAGIELGKRLYSVQEEVVIGDTSTAGDHLKEMARLKKEQVRVLYLDGRYMLVADRVVAVGALNTVSLEPREILSPALELNCVNIVVAHNHPSGNASPSIEDIRFTKRLRDACDIVGIRLLDHLVITKSGWSAVSS